VSTPTKTPRFVYFTTTDKKGLKMLQILYDKLKDGVKVGEYYAFFYKYEKLIVSNFKKHKIDFTQTYTLKEEEDNADEEDVDVGSEGSCESDV